MNKQSNELVSIIIPVYNTADYLVRCIDSAIKQTHENTEIILINDGSTDGSAEICKSYAAKDPRVHLINQENMGQSAARNTGLDFATGQWIAFLDSDDYISRYFVEYNLAACLQHDADIAISGYLVDYDGDLEEDMFTGTNKIERFCTREAVIHHFGKRGALFNVVCSKLYRASIWNDLRFPVGFIWEDLFVSHRMFYSAGTVVVLDAHLYAYYMAPGSTMRRPFSLKRLDALEAWNEGVRFFEQVEERDFSDIARRILCNRLFDAYGICKKQLPDERCIHKQIRDQAIQTYREVRRIRHYIDLSPERALAYRIKQIIGRYCPALYTAMFLRKQSYNL